jgi:signal transduction histidine kinase/ligand-binding sensor domain-containing protein
VNLYKAIFFFMVITACCITGIAQPYRFMDFTVSNGLSQNSVHCIYQDSDGIMWFGTQDGLNSFDGHSFTIYRHNGKDSNSLSDQFILSIAEDNQGYLWVGTRNGLNCFNKYTRKFKRCYLIKGEQEAINNTYPQLVKRKNGEIYVQHDGNQPGIISADGVLTLADTAQYKSRAAMTDRLGRLWLVKEKAGIGYLEGGSNSKWIYSGKLSGNLKVYPTPVIAMDSSEVLWYTVNDRENEIFFYDTRHPGKILSPVRLPGAAKHINIAHDGSGWISTSNGIYIINRTTGTVEKIGSTNAAYSLPAGTILYSFEDTKKNMWVGSALNGLAYYNPAFRHFQLWPTGAAGAVTVTGEIDGNTRWIGTSTGLIRARRDGPGKPVYTAGALFPSSKISALVKDLQGRWWVAVENQGLYILDATGKILRSYHRHDSLLNTWQVLFLKCDSRNRVFVCTVEGYYIFTSPDKWYSVYEPPRAGLNSSGGYTMQALEDRQHRIWLSKNMGIDVLDGSLKKLFSITSGQTYSQINRSIVVGCAEDVMGNIWISTLSSGVYVWRNGQMKQFTIEQGLNSNVTYGIACDSHGRIWILTTSGINVYDPAVKRMYSLDSKDGLPADDYVLNTISADAKGHVFAGSSAGLIDINTNELQLGNDVSEAYISEVIIDGYNTDIRQHHIELQPGYKSVSFVFSLKQALQPRNIIYQYRMNGFEENWNTLSSGQNSITYSNLPLKALTMEVRAAYSRIDLQYAPVNTFTVTVRPAAWQTIWFRIAVALMVLGMVWLAVAQYSRRKYRRQLEAAKVQAGLQQERQRISRDLHDNIGAYTSALLAGIDHLDRSGPSPGDVEELRDYASNIMTYLRETIWLLNHEKQTITAFSDRLVTYARKIFRNYPGITFDVEKEIISDRELSPKISLNLFRILQEALQNACKHAMAGNIILSISSGKTLTFSVRDNGKGMADTVKEEGYGLMNMQLRAAEIGFTVTIHSGKAGTEVVCIENSTYAV